MNDAETLALADALRASVGAFVRAGRTRRPSMAEHHAQTLGFLMREGPLTTAELARLRGIRHQSMQTAINDLESEGHVAREPDPRDQRARLVRLTDQGLSDLRLELARRSAVIAEAITAGLDDDEVAILARVPTLLQRLADGLRASEEPMS